MARVLAGELRPPGSYDGFDIVAAGIAWCDRALCPPRRATAVPSASTTPTCTIPSTTRPAAASAERFRFPYDDGSFDLVIATSVFTHLLDPAAERYLSETARVLAPGGRMLSTWFVLDPASPPEPAASAWTFRAHTEHAARVGDFAAPEAAVAYELTWLREAISRHGLSIREPVHSGSWRGRPGRSFQDIVVVDAWQ